MLNALKMLVCAQFLIASMLCVASYSVQAATLNIAVASNFHATLTIVAQQFELETGHRVLLSQGSTGKQYAQITQGAPFDLFFAADSERPLLLEQQGFAVADTRFTYATGQLALWLPDQSKLPRQMNDEHGLNEPNVGDHLTIQTLQSLEQLNQYLPAEGHIAIANPLLAPYGKAAVQVLTTLPYWSTREARLVRGENVLQAMQFVHSGAASAGLLSYSQLIARQSILRGTVWLLPPSSYVPIQQQAILLNDSSHARQFLSFMARSTTSKLLQQHGYLVAEGAMH